jgi:hypothetical protein
MADQPALSNGGLAVAVVEFYQRRNVDVGDAVAVDISRPGNAYTGAVARYVALNDEPVGSGKFESSVRCHQSRERRRDTHFRLTRNPQGSLSGTPSGVQSFLHFRRVPT